MEENRNEQTQAELSDAILEEVDRRVLEAVKAARAEWERAQDDARLEQDRLSAMTEDERAAYDLSRREAALNERERALMARELKAIALTELSARGLPAELAEVLPYDGESHCRTALDTLEKVFRSAVRASVDERLKGDVPSGGGRSRLDADSLSDAEYYRMTAQM